MHHQELRNLFVNFLENQKGYPPRSINFEVVVSDQSSARKVVDLALIDPTDKEILAIIELKNSTSPAVLRMGFRQLNEYRRAPALVNRNIVSYVVSPDGEDTFSIWKQPMRGDGVYVKVPLDEFPNFSDLSFTAQVQEKIKLENDENIIVQSSKKKAKLFESYTYGAIVGLITAVLGFYLSYRSSLSDKESERQMSQLLSMLESIKSERIKLRQLPLNKSKDSININGKNTFIDKQELEKAIYVNVEKKLHASIEGRVKNIESMLSKEPEKTLSILELKSQVSELKTLTESRNTLYDEKITSLKEKADLLSNLTWALALTVLTTLVSIVFSYVQAKKGQ